MTASGQANDIMSAINRHAGQVLQGPMARSAGVLLTARAKTTRTFGCK